MKMRSELLMVSPDLAAMWLQANKSNRPVKASVVKTYAETIKRGEWKASPQGVSFSVSGRLLDGQHRLMAICSCGLSAPIYVTYDVPDDAFDVLDQGARRSYADISRLPKRVAEMRGYLARMLCNNGIVPTAVQINALIPESFNGAAQRLIDEAAFPRRGIGSAPSAAAAVLRSMQDHGEWVRATYRSMILLDFTALDPAPLAFLKQSINGDDGNSPHRFARAWEAFDFLGRARKKLIIRDVSISATEAKAFITDLSAESA